MNSLFVDKKSFDIVLENLGKAEKQRDEFFAKLAIAELALERIHGMVQVHRDGFGEVWPEEIYASQIAREALTKLKERE